MLAANRQEKKMQKVLVTSTSFSKVNLKQEPGNILRDAGLEATANPVGKPYSEADLLAVISDYDAVIVGADAVTAKVIELGSKVQILAKNGVGIDNIDLEAASRLGIWVTIAPGADQDMAEGTFALMLALARNIVAGDAAVRKGEWPRLMGRRLLGKKLGVIGLGRIGRGVVTRARGFASTDMTPLRTSPSVSRMMSNWLTWIPSFASVTM
jgi:D-3-phosphoglycerate dehydrogenase